MVDAHRTRRLIIEITSAPAVSTDFATRVQGAARREGADGLIQPMLRAARVMLTHSLTAT
jgi:hypothetical protein